LEYHRNRRPGGDLFAAVGVIKDAGQDADLVGFAPLGRKPRLPRPTLVQMDLDIGFGQRYSRRAPVHHAADCLAVAFAPGGHAEKVAERIVRHGSRQVQ